MEECLITRSFSGRSAGAKGRVGIDLWFNPVLCVVAWIRASKTAELQRPSYRIIRMQFRNVEVGGSSPLTSTTFSLVTVRFPRTILVESASSCAIHGPFWRDGFEQGLRASNGSRFLR